MSKGFTKKELDLFRCCEELANKIEDIEKERDTYKRDAETLYAEMKYFSGKQCEDHGCTCFNYDAQATLKKLSMSYSPSEDE